MSEAKSLSQQRRIRAQQEPATLEPTSEPVPESYEIGKRLRERREALGLTQRHIAYLADLDELSIVQIECGIPSAVEDHAASVSAFYDKIQAEREAESLNPPTPSVSVVSIQPKPDREIVAVLRRPLNVKLLPKLQEWLSLHYKDAVDADASKEQGHA